MRTLATAMAMATVLAVPAAAKTLLKNPQRLLPDYVSADDLKSIPRPYIDQWTEGYRQIKWVSGLRSSGGKPISRSKVTDPLHV